ncbi:MAG: NAD(P)-binding protein [Pseudomonadota bacterium]
MKSRDRDLGLHQPITRRDFIHGAGALAGLGLLSGAEGILAASEAPYPPGLTGLRGSHPGAFEVAHQLAREGRRDWGPVKPAGDPDYDLVVVGAGLSGLAAAYFYRQQNPQARILILDNHDDFGGHAKRNEFKVGNRHLIGYGGSQTLEEPSSYPKQTRKLLRDLGVDLDRFYGAYDRQFFSRHGLKAASFFPRERWGVDRLVPYDLGGLAFTLVLDRDGQNAAEAVEQMPLSGPAKAQMLQLLTDTTDHFPGLSDEERLGRLSELSYQAYLKDVLGITEPDVFAALAGLTTDLGGAIDAVPASDAIIYIGLPGFPQTGLPNVDDEAEPYIHHFPDGNASIARLMVRQMIPAVAPGDDMEDIVQARFDYGQLDLPDTPVRLRLSSTVVNVRHDGPPAKAKWVEVSYVKDGQARRVRASRCVMACYNAIIPSVCEELPDAQKAGLRSIVKVPILYLNVALTNWRAWKKLGVAVISAPGSYFNNAMLDFPVSLGGYQFARGPDDPILVHMERFFHKQGSGMSKRQQAPLGRLEMLSTPFEAIEREVRQQLGAMLGDGGFDPARDIAAITVNRWPHGYATRDWLNDEYYGDRNDPRYGFVRGRQPFGRIAIANSDAGALANVESAVEQAHRAVTELNEMG